MPLLLIAAVVVPVLAGWGLASRPVTPERIAAFVRRHRLEPAPADQPQLAAYLGHTRRWRTAGTLAGYLAGLLSALPQDRLAVQFFPALAGWFAGAVVAEVRVPGGPRAPGWVLRLPYVLAAVAVGVTALVFAVDQRGAVLGWGAVGLVVALVSAARPVGVITAVACALVSSCIAHQLAAVQPGFFDAAATAVGGLVLLWTLGGLVVAWCVAVGRRPAPALLVVVTLIVVSGGWAAYAWHRDRPPFPPSAARPTAVLRFTDHRHFDRDAAALGVSGLTGLVDQPEHRQFVGRVDHTTPPGLRAGTTYHVFVIDRRQNRVAPQLYDADGGGWGSQLSTLAARYPWLSATAMTVGPAGYSFLGSAVSRAADSPGPLIFVGSMPVPSGTGPADPLVVLVLTGPDEQIYWATPVTG